LDIDDPEDKSTDRDTVAALVESARRLVPSITTDLVIKTFAANRPAGDEQHRLRLDQRVDNLLHCTDRSAGLRPATAANLCIDGDRPAGVHAATVAEHLLRTRVRLWDTVVILGDGPWSHPVAAMCRRLGTRVIAIADRAVWADQRIDPAPRLSVVGRERITAVRLRRSTGDITVGCDALVLAADPRPNRNVTGALTEGDDNVVFHQPARPLGPEDRFQAGAHAMRTWLQTSGGIS
jgi:hypothetical protein